MVLTSRATLMTMRRIPKRLAFREPASHVTSLSLSLSLFRDEKSFRILLVSRLTCEVISESRVNLT